MRLLQRKVPKKKSWVPRGSPTPPLVVQNILGGRKGGGGGLNPLCKTNVQVKNRLWLGGLQGGTWSSRVGSGPTQDRWWASRGLSDPVGWLWRDPPGPLKKGPVAVLFGDSVPVPPNPKASVK